MGAESTVQPDLILPSQVYARVRCMRPEHQLLLAVLEQALRDLDRFNITRVFEPRRVRSGVYHKLGAIRTHRELIEWFESDRTDYPTSFAAICEQFDLEPGAVRALLSRRGWRPFVVPTHIRTGGQCIKKMAVRRAGL